MMWYWGGGVHWWEWLVGAIGMIAFWALVIWGIWYAVTGITRRDRYGERHDGLGERRDEPRRILDERLARGEIDADEYRHLRDLLAGDGAGARREKTAAGTSGRP